MSSSRYTGNTGNMNTRSCQVAVNAGGGHGYGSYKDGSSSSADMGRFDEYTGFDLSSMDYNPVREIQRKQNHNEAEKKRVRNINKCVDDLKLILDNANVAHKSDKVSTLETAVSYMRDLIKERDRLSTNLGYISSFVSTAVEEEHYVEGENEQVLGRRINPNELHATGISSDDIKPCVSQPSGVISSTAMGNLPCDADTINAKMVEEADKVSTRRMGVDYKSIWINNSLPCIITEMISGKLLKGNAFFVKLFTYTSIEDLYKISFFDIIDPSDLSIFWSEYSQLVNSQQQSTRSFVCTIRNPSMSIQLPCLVTMGTIMDYEGHAFQVAATFTPLKQVNNQIPPVAVKSERVSFSVNISKFL